MNTKRSTKIVRVGNYMAEVEVDLIITDDEWAPYLSLEDARKLDNVRDALKHGDIEAAAALARVFSLTPVAAP